MTFWEFRCHFPMVLVLGAIKHVDIFREFRCHFPMVLVLFAIKRVDSNPPLGSKMLKIAVFGGFGTAMNGDFGYCWIHTAAAQNPRGFVIPNRGFAPPG